MEHYTLRKAIACVYNDLGIKWLKISEVNILRIKGMKKNMTVKLLNRKATVWSDIENGFACLFISYDIDGIGEICFDKERSYLCVRTAADMQLKLTKDWKIK